MVVSPRKCRCVNEYVWPGNRKGGRLLVRAVLLTAGQPELPLPNKPDRLKLKLALKKILSEKMVNDASDKLSSAHSTNNGNGKRNADVSRRDRSIFPGAASSIRVERLANYSNITGFHLGSLIAFPGLKLDVAQTFVSTLRRRLALFSRRCWICHDDELDSLSDNWMRPCLCIGDMRWVHASCMQRWIDTQAGQSPKCRFCGVAYRLSPRTYPVFLQAIQLVHLPLDACGVVHIAYAILRFRRVAALLALLSDPPGRALLWSKLVNESALGWLTALFAATHYYEPMALHVAYKWFPSLRPARYPMEFRLVDILAVVRTDRNEPYLLRDLGLLPAFRQLVLIALEIFGETNVLVPLGLRAFEFLKMQEMSESVGISNESPLQSVPILSLSDDLLSRVFTYLNPMDWFRLADVCTRWAGVSRMDWTDISCLDLSPIPPDYVGPIIQLCPRLESITAQDCELDVCSIRENLRRGLKSLRLYRVLANENVGVSSVLRCRAPAFECRRNSSHEAVFSELRSLPRLEELVLTELRLVPMESYQEFPVLQLPDTLKRLQLSRLAFCSGHDSIESGAAPWRSLECLILCSCPWRFGDYYCSFRRADYDRKMKSLFRLAQLRELCLPALIRPLFEAGADFVSKLSRLEMLYLCLGHLCAPSYTAGLLPIWCSHPTLRILVITGHLFSEEELVLPRRRRYPDGFGSDPLPLLHVFIGGKIAQKIRFTPSDGVEIHPITLPMPAFLELPEIAAIFKGSWIAEMIKKGAKSNVRL